MTYKENKPTQKSMTKGTQLKPITNYLQNIELLQQWYFEHAFPDTRIWITLRESTFNNWKVNRFHGSGNKDLTTPTPTPTPPPITMATIPDPVNEAATFLRSIKRSPSDYTKFKDDSRWKRWHRHLKATSNSHGISQILDPAYVPLTNNARELFQVQQTFMYSVFEQCMHTNKSCHVVQTFESTAARCICQVIGGIRRRPI
jgi:hypothetical protein